MHKGLLSKAQESDQEMMRASDNMIEVPENEIERYHFYMACLQSLIDQEKALGGEFAR